MGCGSSSAASAGSTLSKDAEDFHLEHINFKVMKVPDFDDYLNNDIEPIVNQVVDIINDVNGCIDDIKDAAALILGAFKVDIDIEGAQEHDVVILALQKADGTFATAEEVKALVADKKVSEADAAVAKARKALHAEMEQSYAALTVANDLLACNAPPAAMAALNTELAALRTAVGAAYKVVLIVKSAGAGGAPCARATLTKPVFENPDSEHYTLEPLSVLDVAASKEAKGIFEAEKAVADAMGALTKAVKEAEAAGISVSITMKKKKLVLKCEGGEGEEVAEKKAAVRKAASTANSQLFKLQKAARNANGSLNIARALVAVIDSLKKKAERLAKNAGKEIKGVISVNPKFKFDLEGEVEFDLGLKVNLPDYENMDPMETLMQLLPGPAKIVMHTILGIKDKIIEMIPEFKSLAEQVESAVGRVDEVFTDMDEKIKAAFGETEDMFAIPKGIAAAAGNMKIVATEPIKIVSCMKDTLMRLNDELRAAITELQAMCA